MRAKHSKEASDFKMIDFTSPDSVNAAFRRIISFLCAARPVVLFLDDIHWADQTSLQVLKALVIFRPIEGLLSTVSYRDEEVNEDHPVSTCLKEIGPKNTLVHSIPIGDLDVETASSKVVSSVTRTNPEETLVLAEVIHTKTVGNPFFVVQFLQLL
jgi:predicted ATPase